MTRALPLTPLARSGAISFENGGQSSKRGWGVLMPADYPAPIRRRQTRPGINNSTALGSTADYDRGRRQVHPEQ
jgi:hypothetical protein